MYELKTKKTEQGVEGFLNKISDKQKREDSFTVLKLMQEITNEKPKMWGTAIIGFGNYHYKYPSGQEGDWFVTGFSPRKQALTLYLMVGYGGMDGLLKKLGKFKTGKACLYITKLSDIDLSVLKELIVKSIEKCKQVYGGN